MALSLERTREMQQGCVTRSPRTLSGGVRVKERSSVLEAHRRDRLTKLRTSVEAVGPFWRVVDRL